MVLVHVLSAIMMEYTISCGEVCSLLNRLGIHFSVLYRPNPWQLPSTALNIYSSCLCFIHYITIMIQKKILCVIQFQCFYMPVSTHYNIQSITGTQCNRQTARCKHAPRTCTFSSKNVFIYMSRKNLPIHSPMQTHAWNIEKASIFMTQLGKKFGVTKLRMWMICHGSNSS